MKKERIVSTVFGLMMVVSLLFLLAACGPTEGSGDEIEEGKVITTESGLRYEQIEKGEGPSPQAGDVVSVHYRGTLEDGTEFDSSYGRGEPIVFPLGQGRVIPGWEEGIPMMNEGGKARLTIPPDLAYGQRGAGEVIPPNATLIFEVELLEVR